MQQIHLNPRSNWLERKKMNHHRLHLRSPTEGASVCVVVYTSLGSIFFYFMLSKSSVNIVFTLSYCTSHVDDAAWEGLYCTILTLIPPPPARPPFPNPSSGWLLSVALNPLLKVALMCESLSKRVLTWKIFKCNWLFLCDTAFPTVDVATADATITHMAACKWSQSMLR